MTLCGPAMNVISSKPIHANPEHRTSRVHMALSSCQFQGRIFIPSFIFSFHSLLLHPIHHTPLHSSTIFIYHHIHTHMSLLRYKPYRVLKNTTEDWVARLNLSALQEYGKKHPPINVLVLYGSLRERSFSRLLAFEFARILDRLGADVRVFDPTGLPVKDGVSENHPKVQELRELSQWSHAHLWVSPEQHGQITAVFKNQIDWIPLSLGSIRPTQGRTLAIAQVCGGSQSFNAVNTLRILGRWMRMFTIQNQSSVAKAWTEFDSDDRMKPSDFRERVVDVAEELFKFTIILRPEMEFLTDRHSEREEKLKNGRLLSQAEKTQ
ncbi:flavoprotein-like protein [Dissophora ornata]|nr:flavoprotein-like protein [Dissophora ornata]